jgi:hypothetical protein
MHVGWQWFENSYKNDDSQQTPRYSPTDVYTVLLVSRSQGIPHLDWVRWSMTKPSGVPVLQLAVSWSPVQDWNGP